MVAFSSWNDALYVFHIGRDYKQPLFPVKGIMKIATNQGQLHQNSIELFGMLSP